MNVTFLPNDCTNPRLNILYLINTKELHCGVPLAQPILERLRSLYG